MRARAALGAAVMIAGVVVVAPSGPAVAAGCSGPYTHGQSGCTYTVTPTKIQAWFTSGGGQIRARQHCQTSNGQTDWMDYGDWKYVNVKSVTGSCTYRLAIPSPPYELT